MATVDISIRVSVIITDDATRFRWIHFLARKSDAFTAFQNWLQWAVKAGFRTPLYLVSDNKFNLGKWTKLYKDKNITWQNSSSYSPWQDSIAEHSNQTIFEHMRTMIIRAPHVPAKFWCNAMETAGILMNNLPTSAPLYNSLVPGGVSSNKEIEPSKQYSLVAAWSNMFPDLAHYRQWGSPCWAHLHGSEKPAMKLSPRSKRCFLIGFNGAKIYHLWDPKKDLVFQSSDVIFEDPEPTTAQSTTSEQHASQVEEAEIPSNLASIPDPVSNEIIPVSDDVWLRPAKGMKACIAKKKTFLV